MIRLRNNIVLVFLCIGLLMSNAPAAYARDNDIEAVSGSGTYWGVDVKRVDENANISYSSSTIGAHTRISNQGNFTSSGTISTVGSLGIKYNISNPSVAISSANTSNTSNGMAFTATLIPGSTPPAAVEGSVLCSTEPSGGNLGVMVCDAVLQITTNTIGVAVAAASTGSAVNIYYSGVFLALTTGTVIPGTVLVTTTSARGYLGAALNAAQSTGCVAVALNYGNPNGGLTRVRWIK